MDIIKKCSSKEHEEIPAISYCIECKVHMCNKCDIFHSKLLQNHHSYNIDKDIKDIFTGFCKEEDHPNRLEYYCKDNNILCCASCITKIKGKGKGNHKDCNICFIEEIKEEMKNKLKENIKNLESLSNTIEQSIKQLKIFFDKISENKEAVKLTIQKIFTNIRNTVNKREDELLLKVDELFEKTFFKEDFMRESEKLPNKIKISLEKGKLIDNQLNENDKLSVLINDCLDMENTIKNINSKII